MSKLLDAARAALEAWESDYWKDAEFQRDYVAEMRAAVEALRTAIAEEEVRLSLATIGRPLTAQEKAGMQDAIDEHREIIKKNWPKAGLTDDAADPRLGRGADDTPRSQNEVYLVLSEEERAKGFVRPYRDSYRHKTCGAVTSMGRELSETYAASPKFYGSTYCTTCRMHKPVSEFVWTADGEEVGS